MKPMFLSDNLGTEVDLKREMIQQDEKCSKKEQLKLTTRPHSSLDRSYREFASFFILFCLRNRDPVNTTDYNLEIMVIK